MKKIFVFVFIVFYSNFGYADNIAYLDVQYIIDNSLIGKHYKDKIKIVQEDNKSILQDKEDKIKAKEVEIKNQKNILSKDQIDKKVLNLNKSLKDYQLKRNELNKEVLELKKNYTGKILSLLNPLLTSYVEKNKILLVIEKKNILVGIKSLDITTSIIKILNDETNKKKLLNEN